MVEVPRQRQDHLIAGVKDHLGKGVEGHVAASGHQQGRALQVEALVRLKLDPDRFQELLIALHRAVTMQRSGAIPGCQRSLHGFRHRRRRAPIHHALGQGEGIGTLPQPGADAGDHRVEHPSQPPRRQRPMARGAGIANGLGIHGLRLPGAAAPPAGRRPPGGWWPAPARHG